MGDNTEQKSTTEAITGKAKEKAEEVGKAIADSGVVEAISQASEQVDDAGNRFITGLKSSETESVNLSQQQQTSVATGGRKRRRKSRKSRRKKSRKSRRSRRRKSNRKTRRRRKRRNRK